MPRRPKTAILMLVGRKSPMAMPSYNLHQDLLIVIAYGECLFEALGWQVAVLLQVDGDQIEVVHHGHGMDLQRPAQFFCRREVGGIDIVDRLIESLYRGSLALSSKLP